MKKLMVLFIAIAFFASFTLISCGPQAEPPKPAPAPEKAAPAPAPAPEKAAPAPAPAPEKAAPAPAKK
jgi:hypothetical protein